MVAYIFAYSLYHKTFEPGHENAKQKTFREQKKCSINLRKNVLVKLKPNASRAKSRKTT